jgi:purine-binding chemotaxis protein CheW
VQAVLFTVGTDCYAVPIGQVRQVVSAPVIAPLVTSPASVRGLFNLRGEIVPLLDVAKLLGLGDANRVDGAVVVNTPEGPAGLAVTGVPKRVELAAPTGASELPGTAGTYLVDGRVVVLLHLGELLGSLGRTTADARARTA